MKAPTWGAPPREQRSGPPSTTSTSRSEASVTTKATNEDRVTRQGVKTRRFRRLDRVAYASLYAPDTVEEMRRLLADFAYWEQREALWEQRETDAFRDGYTSGIRAAYGVAYAAAEYDLDEGWRMVARERKRDQKTRPYGVRAA